MTKSQKTKAEMDKQVAVWAEAIRNVKTRLPLKARVVMTEEALAMFPRYRGKRGTIVGHRYGTNATVLWDGRRSADSYAAWFIERVGHRGSAKGSQP